jgi:SAM-dependent methyltransferase
LAALRDEGFDVRGCEISDSAAAEATRRFGLNVHHGPLNSAGLEPASVDVALLYHVLEHVPEPEELLAAVHSVLREGGLAVVEVPNLQSAQMLRPRIRRRILDLPLHLVHFTPAGLERLLSRSGFRVLELSIPFGPPLVSILAFYERMRDRLMASQQRSAPRSIQQAGRQRRPPAGTTRNTKESILTLLRRISSAYKMTAYAERCTNRHGDSH